MALAAAQVIDAIAARLATVVATAARVYTSRTWPLEEGELPAWRVIANDEAVEATTLHWPALQRHQLDVECSAWCDATANLDDAMHALAAAGLAALFDTQAHASLSPLVGVQMALAAIERTTTSAGQAAIGVLTLRLTVAFTTAENAPETLI